jgi:cell division protein ZipA
MEDYLRLGLLAVAAIIIFLILFESWCRRKQLKNEEKSRYLTNLNPDDVLGLEPREPKINETGLKTLEASEDLTANEPGIRTETQLKFDLDNSMAEATNTHIEITNPVQPVTDLVKEVLKPQTTTTVKRKEIGSDLISIYVVAKNGGKFASYDLLQAISATGMQFGEMNIFHYYSNTGFARKALFSLASITAPGDFDLDRMGTFSCAGLSLFTQLGDVPNPQQAFELMLKAAEQLADDLDGELRASPRTLWNNEVLSQYQHKVLEFQLAHA